MDPVKVTRTALEKGASLAGLLLPAECLIAEKPQPLRQPAGGHPPDVD